MKSILIIVLLLIVSIAGCAAQEKGLFICDQMTFDSTSATPGRLLLEVSPNKNQVEFNFGTKNRQIFYLQNVVEIMGHDAIVKGQATNTDKIRLFYTNGLLVGGLVTRSIFVPRTGRYREVRIEFTRQQLTSK